MALNRSENVVFQSPGLFLFIFGIFIAVSDGNGFGYEDDEYFGYPMENSYRPQPYHMEQSYKPPPPYPVENSYKPQPYMEQSYQPPTPYPNEYSYKPPAPYSNDYSYKPPAPEYNYKPEYKPQYEVETKTYQSITYREHHVPYHCGIIPDTNYELYRKSQDAYSYNVADIAPYGKYPWIVLILYKNRVICQGTFVHGNLILTAASCIPDYKSLEYYEVRIGDWDILTDYNEYEAYADRELRVCSRHKITDYEQYGSSYSGYGSGYSSPKYSVYGSYSSSDLIILKPDYKPDFDKFPQVKPLCLPKIYNDYYSESSYGESYGGSSKYKSLCWVAGWYGSEVGVLRNHPSPQKLQQYSYGYVDEEDEYYTQQYYKGYDTSMIQKRAKVKQVPCPSYGYSGRGYGYYSNICFAGVDGYDACVAEQGGGVFCLVKEKYGYGQYDTYSYSPPDYKSYSSPSYSYSPPSYSSPSYSYSPPDYKSYSTPIYSYEGYANVQSNLHPEYKSSSQSYDNYKYGKTIRANPSPTKPYRYRAVLYAVIQKAAKCRKGYDSNGYSYYRKTRPLIATKVDYNTVDSIQDILWSHGYDDSCSATAAKYHPVKKTSSKHNYYFGHYTNKHPTSLSSYY